MYPAKLAIMSVSFAASSDIPASLFHTGNMVNRKVARRAYLQR